MISVAVCDDEKRICDWLTVAVKDSFARYDVDGSVTVFNDGKPLSDAYISGNAHFDIILLDITMKNCDGMTAAKTIREYDKNVMIVFVTASAEYVFSGYEVRAFRYILKPELVHGFAGVFGECITELTKSNEKRFTFQTGSETFTVGLADILYFESDKRKINLYCHSGKNYSFYKKLDEVEEELDKYDFVRCHQSYLVNAKKISSLKGNELLLVTGTVIPVSKHRSAKTNEAFLWAMR